MKNWDLISGASSKFISENVALLLSVMVGVLFLMACKSESKDLEGSEETIDTQKTENMATKENTDTAASITYTEKIKDIPNATTNGATGGNVNMNYQTTQGSSEDWANLTQLYTDLEMSSQQIDQFQNAMHKYQKRLGGSSSNKVTRSLGAERTKQLKDILSDEQFKKFQSIRSDK